MTMRRARQLSWTRWAVSAVSVTALCALGCSQDAARVVRDAGPTEPDLTICFCDEDMDFTVDGPVGDPNECGDHDPGCKAITVGPPGGDFPLHTDPMKDPNAADDGVGRDGNGWLGLDQARASFDSLWIANSEDWGRGTVSKLSSKSIREVARYLSVTCASLATGSKQMCDGTNGCCSKDDVGRWAARKGGMPQSPHQAVQLTSNNPSRTAIDFNGDLYVANRAFGGQSSATRIANDPVNCVDRNKNGRIDTSSDVNGDGVIQTDCNANGTIDDLDDTKGAPCTNGMRQEFYGLDDECVLWTTNTNASNKWGRPLGLAPSDTGVSDVWAGTYNDGVFFRIEGGSGLTKDEVHLPGGCQPYGLAVDASGYAWAPNLSAGPLCYFDTKKPANTGKARDPVFGQMQGYGVSLDRDQNVWVGGLGSPDAYRYTPDRSNGFKNLGSGWWVRIERAGTGGGAAGFSYGIAADSRTGNQYWVWLAAGNGYIVRMPGSDLNNLVKPKVDTSIDGSAYPVSQVAGQNVRGVGVDSDQNIWAISNANSVATRTLVDNAGKMTPANINGMAMGNNKCPSGDACYLSRDRGQETQPYTYSDFTGFGLRNFTRPKGSYSYVFEGCKGQIPDTQWYSILFDAEVPPGTGLLVHARAGKTPVPDANWGAWTPDYFVSPADLRTGMPLVPFDKDNGYLQVEFAFSSASKMATPKLKSFTVAFKCGIPG